MNNSFMHIILSILLFPFKIIRFVSLGLFFLSYVVIGFILSLVEQVFKYVWLGFMQISVFAYHILRNAFGGVYYIYSSIKKKILGKRKVALEKERKRKEKEAILLKEKQEKEERIRQEKLEKKKEFEEKNIYVNEDIKLERKTFNEKLNEFLESLIKLPTKIITSIRKRIYNSTFAKNARNKQDISRNALLIDFDGEDAVKSAEKQLYEYEAKDANGKYVKGYFEAYSKVEVHSYLLAEGFTVYSIKTDKWIQRLHFYQRLNNKRIKNKDLIFFLTQLSTYIKAGIPLVDSLRILERQYRKSKYNRIFKVMIYDLTMGESFSSAMEKQGKAFPSLLINMVKTSEMTGSLPEVLDDMADYYTQTEKTRKEMITAMTYPTIVLIVALAVVTFVMLYVIPKFVEIYETMDASQIPGITLTIIAISDYLNANYIWILILIFALVLGISYLYTNVKLFRTLMQWTLMHTPIVNNIIIYNEVTMFTKTFASLLDHNVFITDSMDILNKITSNEIYRMLILDTVTNLAKGDKISTAFKDHWAFPVPAYEMLVTGEQTGELPKMMRKVSEYYQDLHKNAVARIKTFMEPALIIFLTVVVGIIVLAIVIPMFNMYNAIEKI